MPRQTARAARSRALISLAVVSLLAGCGSSSDSPDLPQLTAPDGLVLGTAITDDAAALGDETYRTVLAKNFGSITPDKAMKWGVIHPEPGRYVWKDADATMALAAENGQRVRGHALLWHGAMPGWVKPRATTCQEARAVLKDHITAVAGRYRGRIWHWDVANEIFQPDGQLRRDENPFLKACGADIVADAFRWTHEVDPEARLYLNDYSTLEGGAKADAQYGLVAKLVRDGVPIHGVGFQGHEQVSTGVPERAAAELQRYADLGLEVMITEADVRMKVPVSDGKKAFAQQAEVYRGLLDLCLKQRKCVGFTVWGFTDRWSWVVETIPNQGNACVMDREMNARPAWAALSERLAEGR